MGPSSALSHSSCVVVLMENVGTYILSFSFTGVLNPSNRSSSMGLISSLKMRQRLRLENNDGDLNHDIGTTAEESGKISLEQIKAHKGHCYHQYWKGFLCKRKDKTFLYNDEVWIVQLDAAIYLKQTNLVHNKNSGAYHLVSDPYMPGILPGSLIFSTRL